MQLARYIDHTLLRPDATALEIEDLCREAREHGFATVCVNSRWVASAACHLHSSQTVPIAVVGFPLGAMQTTAKAFEAQKAIELGAREIDLVISLGDLKVRNFSVVEHDIRAVVNASAPFPVKVIIETGLLTFDEKILACQLAVQAGAHFVKTCTGFSGGSATVEDIQLMRAVVGPTVGVKASGGIRTTEMAVQLIQAGANRLGTSSGVALVRGLSSVGNY
jgi:deoxyribose-phosphate aldolase